MTTCPHCKGSYYRLEAVCVSGADFNYYAVQCSNCGAPVGIVEPDNISAGIDILERKIDALASNVAALGDVLIRIVHRLWSQAR